MVHSSEFEGRVVIVTGAGGAIGFGIAEAFARRGATAIVAELNAERGQAAAEELRGQGLQADFTSLDVTSGESCAAMAAQVMQAHGRIDVLVNNAGLFIGHTAADFPEADWRLQLDVMLTGPFLCAQAVARLALIPQGRGAVVNIASMGGIGGWPVRHAYNAAKAGLISLTQGLAVEWAQYGIRVNSVAPGPIRTEMLDDAIRTGVGRLDRYERRIPLGRVGEVDEVAGAVLFLASDRAAAVTGHNLIVDGGWLPYGNPDGIGYPE